MTLAGDPDVVKKFRDAVDSHFAGDDRFQRIERVDRPDGSAFTHRFAVGEHLWLELAIRPQIPQLRTGILTDDRWKNEELEDAIEESGDTMSEFIEAGFDEVGLEWEEPPVEHYREGGQWFYFATAFEFEKLDRLMDEELFGRIVKMLDGYYHAFRKPITAPAEED